VEQVRRDERGDRRGLTFAIPESLWSLVTRIHHRSGAWGLFGHSGSNVLAAGIRYRF
jgi:hypothetical protein